jgi:hypothetical protein
VVVVAVVVGKEDFGVVGVVGFAGRHLVFGADSGNLSRFGRMRF